MTRHAVPQVQRLHFDLKEDVAGKLFEIPSATTPIERQLAMYYLANQWDGKGDVFENGPLLGGATRALALGMTFNEKRDPDSLLWTYDWFSLHQELDLEPNVWDRLVEAGFLSREEVDAAFERGSFLRLFRALHYKEKYWELVCPQVGYLPGHRDEKAPDGAALFCPSSRREFAIAYIDGCKSWYGTKYWFREMSTRFRPDADILFQDFGHYTCFWLPMLVGTFRECFEPKAYVDYTYVWRLKRAPTEAEIDAAFPDEPDGFNRETYDEVLEGLRKEAEARGDRYYVLLSQMQRAAAYAYLGLLEESRAILDELLMQSEWFQLRPYIKRARVSPAYTPEGPIQL